MPEAEPKKRHPYRSVRFREGRRGLPVDRRVVMHAVAALAMETAGVIAYAAGLEPIAVVLFVGAFTTWLLWALPYAVYLACGERRGWRSTRRHVAALLVWMLAIGAAVGASAWAADRRVQAARRALDDLVRTTARATRRYQADHGHYPETLRALVPLYLARVPAAQPPIAYGLTCPIEYGVWQGVPTLWIPGRDPTFDTCIHRRGFGFDLRSGRRLPR